jgi:hypothetical protein
MQPKTKYILKQFDNSLLDFNMEVDAIDGLVVSNINEISRDMHPLDLGAISDKGLTKWLTMRIIPKNRAFVHEILKALGVGSNDVKGIIDLCMGLSLNDCYWVVKADFDGKFADYNLYDNEFAKALSLIAYTGYGSNKGGFTTSPELTTNGMLRKAWRRLKDNKIYLFKGGSEGAFNTGREPYSEFFASQIAEAMELNAVKYGVSKWKGILCSTCELFTSKEEAFVPIGRLVLDVGLTAVLEYYKNIGEEAYQQIASMLIFDALICNEDRHFGNFGVMVDNKTGKIIGVAPIFDNGLSLFNYAMDDDFKNIDEYARTRLSATGADHLDIAKAVIGKAQKEQLRRLIGFKLKQHKTYPYTNNRVNAINKFLQNRIKILLEL